MYGESILVADDNPQLILALQVRLERDGFHVMTAGNSYGALAKVMGMPPDVIVLDVNMPAGDGFTVQERLNNLAQQGQPKLADIPVIYMTADKCERLDMLAERLGAFAMMHKPFHYRDLAEVVRRALNPPPLPVAG